MTIGNYYSYISSTNVSSVTINGINSSQGASLWVVTLSQSAGNFGFPVVLNGLNMAFAGSGDGPGLFNGYFPNPGDRRVHWLYSQAPIVNGTFTAQVVSPGIACPVIVEVFEIIGASSIAAGSFSTKVVGAGPSVSLNVPISGVGQYTLGGVLCNPNGATITAGTGFTSVHSALSENNVTFPMTVMTEIANSGTTSATGNVALTFTGPNNAIGVWGVQLVPSASYSSQVSRQCVRLAEPSTQTREQVSANGSALSLNITLPINIVNKYVALIPNSGPDTLTINYTDSLGQPMQFTRNVTFWMSDYGYIFLSQDLGTQLLIASVNPTFWQANAPTINARNVTASAQSLLPCANNDRYGPNVLIPAQQVPTLFVYDGVVLSPASSSSSSH